MRVAQVINPLLVLVCSLGKVELNTRENLTDERKQWLAGRSKASGTKVEGEKDVRGAQETLARSELFKIKPSKH